MKRSVALYVVMQCLCLGADHVHFTQATLVDESVDIVSDAIMLTGLEYETIAPPAVENCIFTHWDISTKQPFSPRDEWGVSRDVVTFKLYEDTILTANYISNTIDEDADGIPDGYELYWYGDLSKNAESDTDGDGFTFAEEIANGTNPVTAEYENGDIVRYCDGELLTYNPNGYKWVSVRSEPDGSLLEASSVCLRPATWFETVEFSAETSAFAYWICNGEEVRDEWGRAIDKISFMMSTNDVNLVAVAVDDYETRMKLYWYGTADISMDSDTDGDGFTFAEELAKGTNPLQADWEVRGPIGFADSQLLQYNPNGYAKYRIQSNPEGVLFETVEDYVAPGLFVISDALSWSNSMFACWSLNGVEQRDGWGRAFDAVTFQMPRTPITLVANAIENEEDRIKYYWYGTTEVLMNSDTDGDGFTFAEELANGTDPVIADEIVQGPIVYSDTSEFEMNLQPFEQMRGAIIAGEYSEVFTSPVAGNGATSRTFGADLIPIVGDLNSDGLFDIILLHKSGMVLLINVGTKSNPEFEERTDVSTNGVDLVYGELSMLDGLQLDTPLVDCLGCTFGDVDQDGFIDILVSDTEGRIWFYRNVGATNLLHESSFTLQHKVWGGSFDGFAEGLRIAAVDWEDDGDLDCLAGTADGKLMLLRDPRVGRPTNVKAFAGVDNILLTWDPNQQSRIRGYRLYRAPADVDDFARIAQPQLPTYRDFPDGGGEFDYKVSSVSRFYTAGNSTPTETESMPTEAIRAELGKVKFFWNDVAVKLGEQAAVMLSIENSMNYNVVGKPQTVTYDPAYLTPVKVVKSGITEDVSFTESVDSVHGKWTISIYSAVGGGTPTLPAGGGKFLTLVFDTLKEGTTTVGEATVNIVARPESDPTEVPPYSLGDVNGDGRVNVEDVRLLAKLKNGKDRKPTESQVRAGDFNGNGKLDNADYQALRALLKEKGAR